MPLLRLAAAALLGTVALAAPAHATTYIMDYDWNAANHFQATLQGTLDTGTGRITISSVTAMTRNAVAIAGPLSVVSTDASYGQSQAQPSFNPDGSYLDFMIYRDTGSAIEKLMFQVGDRSSRLFGNSVALTSGWGGNDNFRVFNKASFAVTAAAVPEAASWMMMIAGFGAIGVLTRRRQVDYRVRMQRSSPAFPAAARPI